MFSIQQRDLFAAITAAHESAYFSEVVKDGKWREAMRLEMQALENNRRWVRNVGAGEMQDLPSNKKALGCRWVYKIKCNSNGIIE